MAQDDNDRACLVTVVGGLRPDGQSWSDGTLERLSDAHSVAKKLKGSVQLVLCVDPDLALPESAPLAQHGCSRLRVFRHPDFVARDPFQIAFILAPALRECRLCLCPGDAPGEGVAALLAEMVGTTWVPNALTVTVTRTGALQVNSVLPGGKLARDYRAADGCLVATMKDGVAEAQAVEGIEFEIVDHPVKRELSEPRTRVLEFLPADPAAIDIRHAQKIVAAGRGAGSPEGVELLADLAEELGASLAASRVAVDLGWVPYERQVGQTGRTVRPCLYVAAGISGASHHLQGMRDSDHIIAINTDNEAPIHEVSHLSLPGDLLEVVPAIRRLLKESKT